MLNRWFYSHPTWEVGFAVCLALVLTALAGLYLFHRLVPQTWREEDTPMVGLSYDFCGSLYAVILAFVAAGVYLTMERSATIASDEANSLASLAFDSAGLGPKTAERVRGEVEEYLQVVIEKEWPDQQAYRMDAANFEKGWSVLRGLSADVAGFEPRTAGQASVKGEMEHAINDLFASRRTRLLAARAHLPDAIWEMLIFGLVLVAFYVYMFGPHNYRLHMAVTGLTMLTMGLVFTLVIALDYPFRGAVSVDCDAFKEVREVARAVLDSAVAAPLSSAPPRGKQSKAEVSIPAHNVTKRARSDAKSSFPNPRPAANSKYRSALESRSQ